jgi:hypothetical protein
MQYIITACLLTVGAIQLLPAVGMFGANRLSALYGIVVAEPGLELLLRHRAALFGLIGVFCIVAAFVPSLQSAALAAGAVSVLSFLLLAQRIDGLNSQLRRVVAVDIVAAALLAAGVGARSWQALAG